MNLAPEILNFLGERREFTEVILAPKASPVERRDKRITKIMDVILSPEDIRDTLISLRANTTTSLGPLGREGLFSFGLPEVGRIRVTYLTQRGSYVVSIVKVPYDIPRLENIVSNRSEIERLLDTLLGTNGIVTVIGASYVIHNLFSYSLLQEICDRETGLIYVLERPITYLMKHSNSIVIQREVGVDVDSFEEGVEEALFLNPEIIYMSDVMLKGALKAIKRLFDIPILTVLSVTASSVEALKRSIYVFLKEEYQDVTGLITKVVELSLDEKEKIKFTLTDI